MTGLLKQRVTVPIYFNLKLLYNHNPNTQNILSAITLAFYVALISRDDGPSLLIRDLNTNRLFLMNCCRWMMLFRKVTEDLSVNPIDGDRKGCKRWLELLLICAYQGYLNLSIRFKITELSQRYRYITA